jgi:hypothetical protein
MLYQNHRKRSRIQESRAAKDYGGSVQPGSGNQWHSKADVKTAHELVECKTTTKESYILKYADLRKLWEQAVLELKNPVFEIEFAEHAASYVVLDKRDYLAMREGLEGIGWS